MGKTIYSFLGDFYHERDNVYPAVKKAAEILGDDVILTDCALSELSEVLDLDKTPATIIMACEDRINPESDQVNHWLTPEMDNKITSYVKNGGSFIAIHAALASYPKDSKYTDMLKGYFIDHPQSIIKCAISRAKNCPLVTVQSPTTMKSWTNTMSYM